MKQAKYRAGMRACAAMAILTVAGGAGVPKVTPTTLRALDTLEPGEWQLRDREPGSKPRKLCVSDARQLLQVQHPQAACRRFVIKDAAQNVVVTYDCGAAGSGRTDLRIETSRLAQIQSQGVANAAPFSFTMEARWTGACR
jgi:hypothetical protein